MQKRSVLIYSREALIWRVAELYRLPRGAAPSLPVTRQRCLSRARTNNTQHQRLPVLSGKEMRYLCKKKLNPILYETFICSRVLLCLAECKVKENKHLFLTRSFLHKPSRYGKLLMVWIYYSAHAYQMKYILT